MRGGNLRRDGASTLNKKRRGKYAIESRRDRFGKKKVQEIHPEEPPREDDRD